MIKVDNLVKVFQPNRKGKPSVHGLDHLSFGVEEGEFFVLLGPSGSGKTTCLRMLAGLDRPSSGRIAIDDQVVFDGAANRWVGPEMRPQAMVFQSYALWPQMTVRKNIEFALRHGARRVGRAESHRRSSNVIELLDLGPVADRSVTQLSGGQQQRVALARALALEPKVLLLDEPLSNLDVALRGRVREEIKSLTSRLGITAVLVTHDQEEAFSVGDRIAILNKGRIEQVGHPENVYRHPDSVFVANFLDKMNLFPGVVTEYAEGAAHVDLGHGVVLQIAAQQVPDGSGVTVGIRPSGFAFGTEAPGNCAVDARVSSKVFLGSTFRYDMETPWGVVAVRSGIEPGFGVGDVVRLSPLASASAIVERTADQAPALVP
ncbi:ABC transporter ATP-binding protein [Homoserinimonas sp. A447]